LAGGFETAEFLRPTAFVLAELFGMAFEVE
jgi:hypothetical protein